MRSTPFWRILVALAATAAGCVPKTAALVAHRRYEDAVCHARGENEARLVAEAVERDADVRFQLYAVHPSELAPVLGDHADAVASKVTFVRTTVGANDLPLRVSPYVTLHAGDAAVALLGRTTPDADTAALLFALTGERVPTSVTAIDPDKLRKEVTWAFFTVGLKQLLFGTEKLTYERAPNRADYVASGPRAMAIYDAVGDGRGVVGYLVPRAVEDRTELVVSLSGTTNHEDLGTCSLRIEWKKAIGAPGKTLVAEIDRTFGQRVLRPDDLGMKRTIMLENPSGRWVIEGAAP